MFVLLFAFVFGGAIPLPGLRRPNAYREFLMPGIFAQTIAFAAATTAIGMTDDINKGIIDRFRSLPMARSAVLTGRTVSRRRLQRRHPGRADALRPRSSAGRVHTGIVEFLAGVGLLLLFAFAMSWIGVWLGLSRADRRGGAAGRLHRASSRSPSSRTSSCRRRRCRTGCSRSPSGTRSARSPRRCASCGATRTRSRGTALARPRPDPADAHLGRRHRRDLRPARGAPLPQHEPLSGTPSGGRAPIIAGCCLLPRSWPSGSSWPCWC